MLWLRVSVSRLLGRVAPYSGEEKFRRDRASARCIHPASPFWVALTWSMRSTECLLVLLLLHAKEKTRPSTSVRPSLQQLFQVKCTFCYMVQQSRKVILMYFVDRPTGVIGSARQQQLPVGLRSLRSEQHVECIDQISGWVVTYWMLSLSTYRHFFVRVMHATWYYVRAMLNLV